MMGAAMAAVLLAVSERRPDPGAFDVPQAKRLKHVDIDALGNAEAKRLRRQQRNLKGQDHEHQPRQTR